MNNTDQKISQTFKHRLDEVPLEFNTKKSFDLLHIKLSTKKFYHFHPRQFNVYYAAAIISCFIFTSIVGVHYLLNQRSMQYKVTSLEQELKNKDYALNELNLKFDKVLQTNLSILNKKDSAVVLDDKPKPKQIVLLTPDTTKLALKKSIKKKKYVADTTQLVVQLDTPKVEQPKTLYIVKQDTIIHYDSIPVEPRRAKYKKR